MFILIYSQFFAVQMPSASAAAAAALPILPGSPPPPTPPAAPAPAPALFTQQQQQQHQQILGVVARRTDGTIDFHENLKRLNDMGFQLMGLMRYLNFSYNRLVERKPASHDLPWPMMYEMMTKTTMELAQITTSINATKRVIAQEEAQQQQQSQRQQQHQSQHQQQAQQQETPIIPPPPPAPQFSFSTPPPPPNFSPPALHASSSATVFIGEPKFHSEESSGLPSIPEENEEEEEDDGPKQHQQDQDHEQESKQARFEEADDESLPFVTVGAPASASATIPSATATFPDAALQQLVEPCGEIDHQKKMKQENPKLPKQQKLKQHVYMNFDKRNDRWRVQSRANGKTKYIASSKDEVTAREAAERYIRENSSN